MNISPQFSFRRPYQVERSGIGSYVDGVWTPGSPVVTITINATVQPATTADYARMQVEQGGDRISDTLRLYADTLLNVADPRQQTSADVLLYPPAAYGPQRRYKVIARTIYSAGIIPHYRYLVTAELEK